MERYRIYINLTTGLDKVLSFKSVYKIIRIQSSLIESKSWDKIFYSLDDDLLFHLALGYKCIICDGSTNGTSKVIRIGIPVIKRILEKIWFNQSLVHYGVISYDYLKNIYNSLSESTKNKLKYYRKFLFTDKIKLTGLPFKGIDGNDEYFRLIAKRLREL